MDVVTVQFGDEFGPIVHRTWLIAALGCSGVALLRRCNESRPYPDALVPLVGRRYRAARSGNSVITRRLEAEGKKRCSG
jgi:hypothetical protein